GSCLPESWLIETGDEDDEREDSASVFCSLTLLNVEWIFLKEKLDVDEQLDDEEGGGGGVLCFCSLSLLPHMSNKKWLLSM
ncbi:hypothetical protein BpHYR1_003114, partial [Brachionus plicatilis]